MNYPILALIIANIIWGAASPIFKFALQNIPPFTLAFIRFFFATLIFIPLALKFRQGASTKDFFLIVLGSILGITFNISFFFLGLQKSPSINAPIIASSGPIFLFLLAIIFLKEKPRMKVFLGMVVSLIGVLVIILSPTIFDGQKLSLGEVEGNVFFLIATIGSVFHSLIYKEVLKRVNAFIITFWGFLVGALTFLPFMLRELKHWSFTQLNINGIVGIIFGVFLCSALAYFLFNWGIGKIQAQEIGLFYYIDPVVALLIAMPLLGEYPTIYYFLGAILVFLGIFVAERRIQWHPLDKLKFQSSNVKDSNQ